MQDFVVNTMPEMVSDAYTGAASFLVNYNVWGWAKDAGSVLILVLFALSSLRWSWNKITTSRNPSTALVQMIRKEYEGEMVVWESGKFQLFTPKVFCKYIKGADGQVNSLIDLTLSGTDVKHLLSDKQKNKVKKIITDTMARCEAATKARECREVAERMAQSTHKV